MSAGAFYLAGRNSSGSFAIFAAIRPEFGRTR